MGVYYKNPIYLPPILQALLIRSLCHIFLPEAIGLHMLLSETGAIPMAQILTVNSLITISPAVHWFHSI